MEKPIVREKVPFAEVAKFLKGKLLHILRLIFTSSANRLEESDMSTEQFQVLVLGSYGLLIEEKSLMNIHINGVLIQRQ